MFDADIPEEYQKGYVIFLGCRIDLSHRVLIPRPETEFWTGRAIRDLRDLKRDGLRVLDMFSGSGCVGIAAAKKIPQLAIDLCDIDPNAVEQIKINLEINGIGEDRARVIESDIFKGLTKCEYDVIFANPPYIDRARIAEVQDSVLNYEPHVALFSKKGGMETIEKFLRQAKEFLAPKGMIYLEFDPQQADHLREMIEAEGYSSFDLFKDQFDMWRFAKITK